MLPNAQHEVLALMLRYSRWRWRGELPFKLPSCRMAWQMPDRKALTTVQKFGRFFFYLGGAVFLVGIAPYLLVLLLMATHIIDPTLNPVGYGIAFLVSCPLFLVLILIGVFCRFLISD